MLCLCSVVDVNIQKHTHNMHTHARTHAHTHTTHYDKLPSGASLQTCNSSKLAMPATYKSAHSDKQLHHRHGLCDYV